MKQAEAQRSEVICPRSHSQPVAEPGLNPGCLTAALNFCCDSGSKDTDVNKSVSLYSAGSLLTGSFVLTAFVRPRILLAHRRRCQQCRSRCSQHRPQAAPSPLFRSTVWGIRPTSHVGAAWVRRGARQPGFPGPECPPPPRDSLVSLSGGICSPLL